MNEQRGTSMCQGERCELFLPSVVLCVDSESWSHPDMLGLRDENIENQSWLKVFHDAGVARNTLLCNESLKKVWVVSSDTVEGINLAAAIKHDNVNRPVSLVSFEGSGSLMSRCQAAGVELIRNKSEFIRQYSAEKERSMCFGESGSRDRSKRVDKEVAHLPVEEPSLQAQSQSRTPDESILLNKGAVSSLTGNQSFSHSENEIPSHPQSQPKKNWPVPQPSMSDSDAFVLAVIGGSGGVGKSTVAATAAVMYQRMGYKTLLLDTDLQFGDMPYLLGSKQALEIGELLENPQRISRLQPENGLPALLSAPKNLEQSEAIMERMAELVAFLRGQFEIIVMNTGAFWSEQHAQIIESADRILFLLDQRPASIRACAHALDLCARCGIPTQSFLFVLNFCSRKALLTSLDASCALQGVRVEELKDGGKEVGELLSAGLPHELISTKNPFSESLRELCLSLLPDKTRKDHVPAEEQGTNKKGRLLGLRKRKVAACL